VDVATIIGLILGAGLILTAIVIAGDPGVYVNPQAFLIVIGGACAATMTSVSIARFFDIPRIAYRALFSRATDPMGTLRQLVQLAEIARRDGILALEMRIDELEDPFLVRGVEMAVDGTDPEVIQTVMETELEYLIARHDAGRGTLESLGRFAPAFGMIGTLIGLVAMLSNMNDPKRIGVGMSAALITTLYGALLANLVFLPLAEKLALRSNEEVLVKQIIIQGVMSIQAGDNPRSVRAKLLTFVPPDQRRVDPDYRAAA
jgi:chemotaxis protein MotA